METAPKVIVFRVYPSMGASPSVFLWGHPLPWPDENLFERPLANVGTPPLRQSHGPSSLAIK